jgi:hypothetical protein
MQGNEIRTMNAEKGLMIINDKNSMMVTIYTYTDCLGSITNSRLGVIKIG